MNVDRRALRDFGFRVGTRLHRAVFTVSRGRLLGRAMGMTVVKLVTVGRRSGARRSVMLAAPIISSEHVVLVASKGGDPRHPAWYHNLRAYPDVEVTLRGERRRMRARVVTGTEHTELWRRVVDAYAGYARYQARTERPIPLVVLDMNPSGRAPITNEQ